MNTADAEFFALKVSFKKFTITVISIYIRPGRDYDTMDALKDWCKQHKRGLIVAVILMPTTRFEKADENYSRRLEQLFLEVNSV